MKRPGKPTDASEEPQAMAKPTAEELEAQRQAFLAQGGVLLEVPQGASGVTSKEQRIRIAKRATAHPHNDKSLPHGKPPSLNGMTYHPRKR
jgi:hypothetical protein